MRGALPPLYIYARFLSVHGVLTFVPRFLNTFDWSTVLTYRNYIKSKHDLDKEEEGITLKSLTRNV